MTDAEPAATATAEASQETDLKDEQKSFDEGPPLGAAGRSDSLLSVRDQLDELHRRRDEVRRDIEKLQADEASLTEEISSLEAQLNGDEGPGEDAPMHPAEGHENLADEDGESEYPSDWGDEEPVFAGSEHGRSGSEERERAEFAHADEHPDGRQSLPNDQQPPPEDREHKDAAHATDDRMDGRPHDHEHRAADDAGERASSPRRTSHAPKEDNGKLAGDHQSSSRRPEYDHRQHSSGQPGANDDKLADFYASRPSYQQGDKKHAALPESRPQRPREERPRQSTGRDAGNGGDTHRRTDRRATEKDKLRPSHPDDRPRRSSTEHKPAASHPNSGSRKYERDRGADHADRARRSSRPKHETPMLAPRPPGNDRAPMHSSTSRGGAGGVGAGQHRRPSRDHHPSAPSGQGSMRQTQKDARPPATHSSSHHRDGYRERPSSGGGHHRPEQPPRRPRGSGGGSGGGGAELLQPARHHADAKSRQRSRSRRMERRAGEHDGRGNGSSHQSSTHHPGGGSSHSHPLRPAPGHSSGGHGHPGGHASNHAPRARYH
mmetsp:Transcript_15543/g.35589  ORF Transcript_15543/g.35589 Transcript_15543/m.35589 type:complete len:548 (+) Transcript_15543:129-1772(+)